MIESNDGRITLSLDNAGISGRIGELSTVTVEHVVSDGTPQQKSFTAESSSSSGPLGSVVLGSTTLGAGMGSDMVDYDKLFAIYPRYGSSYQLRVRSTGEFTLSSFSIAATVLGNPLLTLQ